MYIICILHSTIQGMKLKSIRVHLDPGSQLVCLLTQTLVIVTTVCIFVANLRVESVRAL